MFEESLTFELIFRSLLCCFSQMSMFDPVPCDTSSDDDDVVSCDTSKDERIETKVAMRIPFVTEMKRQVMGTCLSHLPRVRPKCAIVDGMNVLLSGCNPDQPMTMASFTGAIANNLVPVTAELLKRNFRTIVIVVKFMFLDDHMGPTRFVHRIFTELRRQISVKKIRIVIPNHNPFSWENRAMTKATDDRLILKLITCIDADWEVVTDDQYRDMFLKMVGDGDFSVFSSEILKLCFFDLSPLPDIKLSLCESKCGALFSLGLIDECPSGTRYCIPAASFTDPKPTPTHKFKAGLAAAAAAGPTPAATATAPSWPSF